MLSRANAIMIIFISIASVCVTYNTNQKDNKIDRLELRIEIWQRCKEIISISLQSLGTTVIVLGTLAMGIWACYELYCVWRKH